MEPVRIPPFESFYAEHKDPVFAHLRRLLGSGAEDAFQETFLRALRAYPELRHGRHLRAWVFTIATRVAIDETRRTRPRGDLPELAVEEFFRGRGAPGRLFGGAPLERKEQAIVINVSPELDTRFRAAAAAEGLLDVAYDVVESPVGELFVGVSERGLCVISYEADPDLQVERLARGFGSRVLRSPRPVDPARRQLDEYFAGKRKRFDLDVDLRLARDFGRTVLEELGRVPFGEVTTYGALAAKAGKPKAARAVGTIMNRNPIPIVLPCHRVVGANGSLVGYAGGLERKQTLLRLEGALLA